MKSFFTLLAFLCLFEYVFADEMYSPDINGLYDASLIVTGTPQLKNGEVEFSILNVLKNSSGESYNSQSSVHFSPTRYGVLSMMNPQTVADTLIVYLRKYKGKWYTYGGSQQIHSLKNGQIPFDFCNEIYWLTPGEYLRMKKQFFTTFKKVEEQKYEALFSEDEYSKKNNALPVVQRMYSCNYFNGPASIDQAIEHEDEIKNELKEDTTIYQFVDQEALYPGGADELMLFFEESWKKWELNAVEKELMGKVYVSFIIETSGKVTQVKILRGVMPSMDHKVIQMVYAMPNWIPAETRGKKVRFMMRIPVPIPSW